MPKRGAQGAGSIRKKTVMRNGIEYTYWEARYTAGYDPGTGKQIQKSISGKTQKEVRQKLQKITIALDEGTYSEPSKMTVGEWLDIWHKDYLGAVKQATVAHYGSHIEKNLKPRIGAIKLSALKPHAVQALYNGLLRSEDNPDGMSAKTVKNLHGVLHRALKQAVMLGYIPSNPTDACVLPRVEKKEVSFIEEDNISVLLEAIKGHRFENVYKVDLFTGMRQGEILGLTWDCVDFDTSTLTICKQLQKEHKKGGQYGLVSCKTDRVRRIRPAPFVMDILRQQRQKQRQERLLACGAWCNDWNLVFTNEIGGHLCTPTVYNHFKAIVKRIGLPAVRFHDMRHTYAMISLQNGDDIKTVQENVGHATAAFTLDVYGHVSQRMKQESAYRMQGFFEGLKPAGSVKGK
ncbi:MAG: tyrosine-type recombinase/integrase [Clostridia bacterium]|nr:tyrosine-type recombinase/integrase [Clostridia bacterium]